MVFHGRLQLLLAVKLFTGNFMRSPGLQYCRFPEAVLNFWE